MGRKKCLLAFFSLSIIIIHYLTNFFFCLKLGTKKRRPIEWIYV